jgi:hypothetical protein
MSQAKLRAVPDAVDQAIAAASEPAPVQMIQVPVTIGSTGRPAQIIIPADATDSELAELCGWMLTSVMGSLRAQRAAAPASRIILPS